MTDRLSENSLHYIKGQILFVNDNADMRRLVLATLSKTFPLVQIIEAYNGMNAGAELAKNSFSLVICNVEMTDDSSLWLYYFMQEFHSKIPLAFLTLHPKKVPTQLIYSSIISTNDMDHFFIESLKSWKTI